MNKSGISVPKLPVLEKNSFVLQSRVENNQQQVASLEPASHLQGLRDRDTVTRFDQEVSMSLSCGYVVSSCHDGDLVIKCGSNSQQVDPDKFQSSDFSLALSKRTKFQEAAKQVRLDDFKNFNNAFFVLLYSCIHIHIYPLPIRQNQAC